MVTAVSYYQEYIISQKCSAHFTTSPVWLSGREGAVLAPFLKYPFEIRKIWANQLNMEIHSFNWYILMEQIFIFSSSLEIFSFDLTNSRQSVIEWLQFQTIQLSKHWFESGLSLSLSLSFYIYILAARHRLLFCF